MRREGDNPLEYHDSIYEEGHFSMRRLYGNRHNEFPTAASSDRRFVDSNGRLHRPMGFLQKHYPNGNLYMELSGVFLSEENSSYHGYVITNG